MAWVKRDGQKQKFKLNLLLLDIRVQTVIKKQTQNFYANLECWKRRTPAKNCWIRLEFEIKSRRWGATQNGRISRWALSVSDLRKNGPHSRLCSDPLFKWDEGFDGERCAWKCHTPSASFLHTSEQRRKRFWHL